MSRKRYISTDMSKSGKLEELARRAGDYGVLLFTWMIPHLDDWGRMEGEPDKVFFEVTPRFAMLGKTPEDAERAIAAMHDIGLITWYEVDGNRYIQANLDTFYSLQTYIPKAKRAEDKSHYPPPPAEPNDVVAQNSTPQQPVAQNSTESRKVAQNTPSPFSLHPSPSDDDDNARAREGEQWSEFRQVFAEAYGGLPNSAHYEEIDSFLADGMSLDAVVEAVRRAALNKAKGWSYVRRILQNWLKDGLLTAEQIHEHEAKRQTRTRASPPSPPQDGLPSWIDQELEKYRRIVEEQRRAKEAETA